MQTRPESEMGDQHSRIDLNQAAPTNLQSPPHTSQKRAITEALGFESQILGHLEGSIQKPVRCGVERNEVVLEQLRNATYVIDLTEGAAVGPPQKIRKLDELRNTNTLAVAVSAYSNPPSPKHESHTSSTLIDRVRPQNASQEKFHEDGGQLTAAKPLNNDQSHENENMRSSVSNPCPCPSPPKVHPSHMPFGDDSSIEQSDQQTFGLSNRRRSDASTGSHDSVTTSFGENNMLDEPEQEVADDGSVDEDQEEEEEKEKEELPFEPEEPEITLEQLMKEQNRSVPTQPSSRISHYPDMTEDLEAGARRLEAYTKFNNKQKAGPKTLFTPRHELDMINGGGYQQQRTIKTTPPVRQKFYSAFDDCVPLPKICLRNAQKAADEARSLTPSNQDAKALSRAPNLYGGLATLAQKAGREADGLSNISFPNASIGHANNTSYRHRSTTISASEYRVDFSRYKQQLSQEEQDVITRHEWLKERQRDLKLLKPAYIEAASLACVTGVTTQMETELTKLDEFKELVLERGQSDKAKRCRLQQVKLSMLGRRKCDVSTDRVESSLGMLIDRRSLQRIEDELKNVEDEMEIVAHERLEMSHKRGSQMKTRRQQKKVRFASPKHDGGSLRPKSNTTDGTANSFGVKQKAERRKKDSEEYRRNQSAAYWNSQAKKEAALREKLQQFDRPVHSSLTQENPSDPIAPNGEATKAAEDAESEVSEEEDGWEIYPGFESATIGKASKPLPTANNDVSLEEMTRLDEERRREEAHAHHDQPTSSSKADHAPAFTRAPATQAPDVELASQMRRAQLGIPDQDAVVAAADDVDDDSDSTTSEDDGGPRQMITTYIVYARYQGVPSLADDLAKYRLGKFLKKANAEAHVAAAVIDFCNARKGDIAAAAETADEEALARLGDPEAGSINCILKPYEQSVEYPASSCRVWVEQERVPARSRAEKNAVPPPTYTYAALWERTLADGSKYGPSWNELVSCAGPAGRALANREAAKIMGDWYAEHLADGYLAMQRTALEDKARALGEEEGEEGGLFDEEETLRVEAGEETMRVWVDRKRNRV